MGLVLRRFRPDQFDVIGGLICFVGIAIDRNNVITVTDTDRNN